MLSSLLTLPLRLGVRGAGLALQTTQVVAERAIGLVGHVVMPTAGEPRPSPAESSSRAQEDHHQGNGGPPADPRSQAGPIAEALVVEDTEPAVAEPESAPPAAAQAVEAEPDHVSEEATVVEEVAEPGAEDGAGAQIRIAEPWDGYSELKAADVVDRVSGLDAAALAAVELYELSHRRRQTVLDAVTRELRRTQQPGQ